MNTLLDFWKKELDINETIIPVKLTHFEVTGEAGKPPASLVGVSKQDDKFYLFYTRKLTKEDIIHELLHVKYPDKIEEEIVQLTQEYLDNDRGCTI